jgi:hypothetical protein
VLATLFRIAMIFGFPGILGGGVRECGYLHIVAGRGGDVPVIIGTIALQPLTVRALSGVGAASGLLITNVRVVGDPLAAVVDRRGVGPQLLIPLYSLRAWFQAWPMRCRDVRGGRRPARAGPPALAGHRASPRARWCRSSPSGAACAGGSHDPAHRVAVAAAVAMPSSRAPELAEQSPSLWRPLAVGASGR